MKAMVMSVLLGAFVLMSSDASRALQAKPAGLTIRSSSGAGCADPNAGTPEVYSFFGDGKRVMDKLTNLSVELPKRKTYVLMVEGANVAEVFLYERAGKDKVALSRWSAKSATDLGQQIEAGIMSNRGINCAGEQTKSLVKKAAGDDLRQEQQVDAPATVKAALSHTIQQLGDNFIRVTVILLC